MIQAFSISRSLGSNAFKPNQSTMKMIIVALALVAVVLAAEVPVPQIIRSNYDQSPEGSYNFGFETENGIKREEIGELKEALDEDNKPHPVVVVRGTYSYINEEGKEETISYIADESGYHPEGPSIPVAAVARR